MPANRKRKFQVLVEVTLSQLSGNTHRKAVAVVRDLLEEGERSRAGRGRAPAHVKFTTKSYQRHIITMRAIMKGSRTATWRHHPKMRVQ